MANTYTDKLKLRMPALGDTGWDDEVNDNIQILEVFLAGLKQGNSVVSGLAPSDGGGLDVAYSAGVADVGDAKRTISGGSKTCTASAKNWLYVNSSGTVVISTTAPTGDFCPIAMIDAAGAAIDRIADMRFFGEVHTGYKGDQIRYAEDAEASDAYIITLSPAPAAYYAGMVVNFKANTANTGAATLNVNALGVKTIKKNYIDDLQTGDIEAGQVVGVIYDGTNFQMANPGMSVGGELIKNLKPVVNAAVNKLDIFTKTGGAAPDVSNRIFIAIPDGNGHTFRSRAAAYLSGNSQIIMADAANYWGKGSLDAEIKTAYLYAIWDGTGIVWALAGYAGFNMVPTTTTVTDDDYFLLEGGSTYTRSNAHYCVAVAKIRYQYDTADTPDHTIQATVENAPQVIWNPKSDYGITKFLSGTVSSGSDITEASQVSFVVKQTGKFLLAGNSVCGCGSAIVIYLGIKTGSATYSGATLRGYQRQDDIGGGLVGISITPTLALLNIGDTVHLGIGVAGSGTRTIYGSNQYTHLTATRID